MSKKVAIYARVSTDDQRDNFSLPGQIEDCRKYATEKGYEVIAEFQEVYSGAQLYRPELNKLRDLLGTIQGVIVYELDRLSRNAVFLTIIENEFEKAGAPIEYVIGYDKTPEGQLMKTIQAGVKEYEREIFKMRSMLGKTRSIKSGRVTSPGTVSYGYRYVDGKLEIAPEEAEIVRNIYHWYVYGDENGKKLGTGEIALRLSELKIPTRFDSQNHPKKKRQYGVWSQATILAMIKNEVYAGTFHYRHNKTEVLCVEVTPIVEKQIWELAQQQVKDNFAKGKRNLKYNYLMRGLMVCATCNCIFGCHFEGRTKSDKNGGYYVCRGQKRGESYDNFTKTCGKRYIKQKDVDELVWNAISEILKSPESLLEGFEKYKEEVAQKESVLDGYIETIDKSLEKLQIKRDKIIDLFLDDDSVAKEVLKEKLIEIEKKIEKFEKEKREIESGSQKKKITETDIAQVYEFSQKISKGIDLFTFEQKRMVIETLGVKAILKRGETKEQDEITIMGIFPYEIDIKAHLFLNINSTGFRVFINGTQDD